MVVSARPALSRAMVVSNLQQCVPCPHRSCYVCMLQARMRQFLQFPTWQCQDLWQGGNRNRRCPRHRRYTGHWTRRRHASVGHQKPSTSSMSLPPPQVPCWTLDPATTCFRWLLQSNNARSRTTTCTANSKLKHTYNCYQNFGARSQSPSEFGCLPALVTQDMQDEMYHISSKIQSSPPPPPPPRDEHCRTV